MVSSDIGGDYVRVGDTGVVEKIYKDGRIKVVSDDETKWQFVINNPGNFSKASS